MNRKTSTIAAAAIAVALTLPAAAGAHVTLQPSEAPAGGFTRLDVRVPNEDASKATTKIELQMPPGFASASYEPVPGWDIATATRKLATPVTTDEGDTVTEEVSKLTFTATGDGIGPGEFQDFGLSVGLPDKAGSKLTFKAIQTYEGNKVVRWIGAPGSDRPAPQVTLVADSGDEAAPATPAAAATASDDDEDDEGNTLPIIALIVGALGLLAGGAALVRARG